VTGGAAEVGEAVEPDDEPADEPDEPQSGPVIHVPDRELGTENGDAPAPVKKKTRRGSRGGKNRRKAPAAAAGVAASAAPAEAEPPQAFEPEEDEQAEDEQAEEQAPNGDENWGYTPMSEWGIDGGSE